MNRSTAWSVVFFLAAAAFASCAGVQTKDGPEAEYNRGLSLFNRGRFAEAVPAFERATELKPEWGEAYLYLGRSYLSLGEYQKALPPLRAAFRLSPGKTKQEAGELILDIIVRNAGELDPLLKSQFEELIKAP